MAVHVGRIALSVRTVPERHDVAGEALRQLRQSIGGAFDGAASREQRGGVALIPKMRVTMRASLGRVSGDDLARAIADACIKAAAGRCTEVDPAEGSEAYGSRAERIVQLLDSEPGVRCEPEEEAAAWLVASMNGRQSPLWRMSAYSDLSGRGVAAAFCEMCARVPNARAIIRALGRQWAVLLASRCTDAQSLTVLQALNDGKEPVRALGAAIDGTYAQAPGVAAAGQIKAEAALASNLAGVWLLLPHIANHRGFASDRAARATALAIARYLGGSFADDDPAVMALCEEGESLRELAAAIPDDRVERVAVSAIRDFAQKLSHFEGARCGYVLRAMLGGPGIVRRVEGGWSASLPHSPLRIVLQRASLVGELNVPWDSPRLFIERDDD